MQLDLEMKDNIASTTVPTCFSQPPLVKRNKQKSDIILSIS